jgi:hypothetical protein
MAISDLRGAIATTARNAWDLDEDEISDFRRSLINAADSLDIADEFEECAEERNFQSCLEEYAEDAGLDDELEGEWGDAPDDLMDDLRDVGDAWGPDERDEARAIAYDANLDELNKKCAQGKIDEVQEELDMDVVAEETTVGQQISNFSECVEAVSAAQGVSDALKEAWDVDG